MPHFVGFASLLGVLVLAPSCDSKPEPTPASSAKVDEKVDKQASVPDDGKGEAVDVDEAPPPSQPRFVRAVEEGKVQGVKVYGVTDGSAAHEAGLRTGDLIASIDDKPLADAKIGGDARLGVRRGEEEVEVAVTADVAAEIGLAQGVKIALGGEEAGAASAAAPGQPRLVPSRDGDNLVGYKVFGVRADSKLAFALENGDLIVQVDGKAPGAEPPDPGFAGVSKLRVKRGGEELDLPRVAAPADE